MRKIFILIILFLVALGLLKSLNINKKETLNTSNVILTNSYYTSVDTVTSDIIILETEEPISLQKILILNKESKFDNNDVMSNIRKINFEKDSLLLFTFNYKVNDIKLGEITKDNIDINVDLDKDIAINTKILIKICNLKVTNLKLINLVEN